MADDGVPYGRRLTELAHRQGEGTALITAAADGGEHRYGWAELESRANQVAAALARAGVGAGDLVAVGLPATVEHVLAVFAAWKLGAAVLPLRPELPGWERDRMLALAEPRVVVGDWPDASAGTLTGDDVRATVGEDDVPPPGDPVPPYARLIATSGSTGTPKIIVAPSPGRYVPPDARSVVPAGQVSLAVCPLYHANGFASCFPPLLTGDPVVLVEKFDAARVVDLIERHRVSVAIMVPTMLQRIARLDGVRDRDFTSLQRVVYGAAVLPDWVARTWLELVPPEKFMFTYGGSEGLGIVACTGAEWLTHPGTTGRGADCDVVILDAERRELPVGEIGEVWLRRKVPGEPFRYVGADTPAPLDGGWRSFGDMGRVDDEGYLYIADRRQDMIVTGGVNVFPAEVETALSEHPEVADVAVVGLPHPEWQRAVHAVVQPRDPAAPPAVEDLRAWCKQRLAGPKVPKAFEFVAELPRTTAGKINRSRLAAERTGSA